ncbi:MAG: hypothetical protein P8H37_11100 [Paracoccaceae bacterium]|nr:hypothetical protein [Paracoccaceae bacterium]
MSLLDDVSIVVTPNAYKAGTLYGVLPTATLGSDLASGYDFTSGWNVFGGGTTITNNTSFVSQSGQGIYAGLGIVANKTYKIKITGTQPSGGYFSIKAGTTGTSFGNINGTSFNETIYATPTVVTGVGNDFYIRLSTHSAGTTITITDLEVQEWTASDMDVTRATAATRVDENGLVNYAEVLGSEEVSCGNFECANPDGVWNSNAGAGWSISGGTATYDGSGGTQPITQNITNIQLGKLCKLTIDVLANQGGGANTIFFGGTVVNSSHLDVGSYTFYDYFTSNTNLYIYGRSNEVFEIDNISLKQLDRNNVPRIDYTGGGCPHILAEPQRTNLLPYSEDFTASNYIKTRCTITSNQSTSPNGTLTADLMTATDDDARLGDQVGSSGVEYTQSIYVKSAQISDVDCQIDFAGLNTVTFTANQEWQRVNTTLTDISQNPRLRIRILNSGNSIYVWGGQLEAGSYATSYIPTSGSSVTRNQDEFTKDGISSLINDSEGVLFVEMAALADDGTNRQIAISDGTTSQRNYIGYRIATNQVIGGSVNTSEIFLNHTLSDSTENIKIAFKYKVNDLALWVNGVEVDTSSSTNLPTGLDRLNFDDGYGGSKFFGKVKQVQVYDTALTDMQLIQLTGTSGTDFYESYSEMAESLTYTIQ